MRIISTLAFLGAAAASSEVSMMKSPVGLRKLGLERHAEMAEFGKGFYPLAIRIDRLESILKDALLGAAPRPVDEADDFSKCGCASPSDTRNDAMELPAGQKDGKFAKTEGQSWEKAAMISLRPGLVSGHTTFPDGAFVV